MQTVKLSNLNLLQITSNKGLNLIYWLYTLTLCITYIKEPHYTSDRNEARRNRSAKLAHRLTMRSRLHYSSLTLFLLLLVWNLFILVIVSCLMTAHRLACPYYTDFHLKDVQMTSNKGLNLIYWLYTLMLCIIYIKEPHYTSDRNEARRHRSAKLAHQLTMRSRLHYSSHTLFLLFLVWNLFILVNVHVQWLNIG